jgi:hypothetical protein
MRRILTATPSMPSVILIRSSTLDGLADKMISWTSGAWAITGEVLFYKGVVRTSGAV